MAPQDLARRSQRRAVNTGGGKTDGGGVKGEARQPWQHEEATPCERVASLLLSPRLADLTISFPGRHNPVRAHRMVLAMHSPVLEACLYHGVGPGLQVLVSQDPPEAFLFVLRHMYRGPAPLPSLGLALQVALLARKYQVLALLKQCSQYLRENVTPGTVLSIYNVATTIKDLRLLQRCVKMVRECGASLLLSPSVGQLERPALAHLLKYLTQASHALVFRCIITWGQVRMASRGVDPHRSQLKEEVDEFLPRVSFLAMTTNEFVEHVMPSGVFSPEEDLAILLNIAGYKVNLPQPCVGVGKAVEEGAKGGGKGGGKEGDGGGPKKVRFSFY
ncbi:BTB/POZ domain-containing protein 6-A-like [Eriocheir sinensis]|uniref:BTB/POZ domain-containing protein 6-A-like n=1 Tax=Eriocheir sinensis TaxID=95602 RepID=UPI0021C821FD|nr:BTB/POZ domain-containing protein 6-A-like [Eriocheir sinensis]